MTFNIQDQNLQKVQISNAHFDSLRHLKKAPNFDCPVFGSQLYTYKNWTSVNIIPKFPDTSGQNLQNTVGARIPNARNPNPFEIRNFFCSDFEWSTIRKPTIRKPNIQMAALA